MFIFILVLVYMVVVRVFTLSMMSHHDPDDRVDDPDGGDGGKGDDISGRHHHGVTTKAGTATRFLEIVRLGVPRLGTGRKQTQGFDEKVIWPPMALRIGLLRSSAVQNDGLYAPVILQCRTPQETNPGGHITFS